LFYQLSYYIIYGFLEIPVFPVYNLQKSRNVEMLSYVKIADHGKFSVVSVEGNQ
jgi:hypothetical protein